MTPKEQLDVFIERFTPEVAKIARGALARMRKLAPGALELVYDNYNALAIGFSPTERASDGIFSIALYPPHASLFFLQGAKLPDPTKRLRGSGNVVRHIVLEDLSLFEERDVRALIDVALARAKVPLDAAQRRKIVIKSVSAKQRPRRPTRLARVSPKPVTSR
jgi:hypothetical protein